MPEAVSIDLDEAGLSLSAEFIDDDGVKQLTQGMSEPVDGHYSIDESTLDSAGLGADDYSARIVDGNGSFRGVASLSWTGSTAIPSGSGGVVGNEGWHAG